MNMCRAAVMPPPFVFIRPTACPCANEWFSIEVGGYSFLLFGSGYNRQITAKSGGNL